jgi:hypothetical protein
MALRKTPPFVDGQSWQLLTPFLRKSCTQFLRNVFGVTLQFDPVAIRQGREQSTRLQSRRHRIDER